MILLIDNYDSFSYNLYQLIGTIDEDIRVVRNDEATVADILGMRPDRIVLSPGPGRPQNAGVCMSVASGAGDIPVLGVCLGHQAICEAFGGTVSYAKALMHGKQSEIILADGNALFDGLPKTILGARYHSLAAVRETLPETLRVTAETNDGEVMAVAHRDRPVFGVQFHPESILTPDGAHILRNFVALFR